MHATIRELEISHHFKKRQYSAACSGFKDIEDNTDRVQSRQEFSKAKSSGSTPAEALALAKVDQADVVGIAESHCASKKPTLTL